MCESAWGATPALISRLQDIRALTYPSHPDSRAEYVIQHATGTPQTPARGFLQKRTCSTARTEKTLHG